LPGYSCCPGSMSSSPTNGGAAPLDFPTGLARLLPHISRHTPFGVDQAPKAVGLYAWYGEFDAGPMDWKVDVDPESSRDLGIDRLLQATSRHSARYYPPPLEVSVSGRLLRRWEGRLSSTASALMRKKLASPPSPEESETDTGLDATGASALGKVLERPTLRGAFVDLVSLTAPVFSSPLYVGVTDDLRRRLGEHARDLEKFAGAVDRNPDVQSRLQQADKNFACRAVGSGFPPDALSVWTLNLETLYRDLPAEDARVLVEAVEWLLNRWHKPQLGKR
jgi:hypothetical protein